MRRNRKLFAVCLLAIAAIMLCPGCMQANIKEDEIREDLVALDPQAGLDKEINFICYSQLLDEPYLAGINRNVVLGGGERAERAMIEAVIQAPTAISGEQGRLFPKNTKIVDINMDGKVLYLTLSKEFVDDTSLKNELASLGKGLEKGELTQIQYEEKLKEAGESFYQRRKMAVYALVNTVSGYSEDTRLLILVDIDGKGIGTRLPRSVFFSQDSSSALIEPLGFEKDITISSESMTEMFLRHFQQKEYDQMYALLTFYHPEDMIDHHTFESRISACGELKDFQVNGMSLQGNDIQQVNVNMTISTASGQDVYLENCRLTMRNDEGLFRPDYTAFMQILEEL